MTAVAQRSKTSLTSRLMVVADSGPGCAESEAAAAKNASFASKRNPSTELELESRLITHRHAVEHVARCAAPVSLGAFRQIAKRPRVKDPCRRRRCQSPLRFSAGRHDQHLLIFDGNRRRLWRLIITERNDCRTNEHSCNRNWIRSKG